jgi:hypothetical protein
MTNNNTTPNNVTNMPVTSRFDYVAYDEKAQSLQQALKEKFQELEAIIQNGVADGRAKSLIWTKLEEAYMWVGKGIRDAQWARTGVNTLNEQRSAS